MSRFRKRIAKLEASGATVPTLLAQGYNVVCLVRNDGESDADFEARRGPRGPDDVEVEIRMKFDTELKSPAQRGPTP